MLQENPFTVQKNKLYKKNKLIFNGKLNQSMQNYYHNELKVRKRDNSQDKQINEQEDSNFKKFVNDKEPKDNSILG